MAAGRRKGEERPRLRKRGARRDGSATGRNVSEHEIIVIFED